MGLIIMKDRTKKQNKSTTIWKLLLITLKIDRRISFKNHVS